METARKSKKRGVTLIEIVIGIGIIGILTGYAFTRYQRMRYKNALDSDRIKILTVVNNTNVMSTVLPKNLTVLPKYIKFIDKGIIVSSDSGELEVDKGFNTGILEGKKLSVSFNCGENNPVIKDCPLIVHYPDSNITSDDDTQIPTNIQDKTTRNNAGFIEFSKGAPEVPFTVYTFDEKGIAKNRIKFSTGDVMKISIYEYIGAKTGSDAWTRNNTQGKNPDKDADETPEWKKENLQKLPLKIEIN